MNVLHSDLSDQNLFHSTIDAPPGVSKDAEDQLKSTLVSSSTKIQPKLKKLWKTVKIEQKLISYIKS